MNILLLNLKSDDKRSNNFPLGLAYLSSTLKPNNIKIFDLGLSTINELISIIINDKFEVVGISCFSEMFIQACEIAKLLKELFPKIIVVLGGYHATAEYYYIVENHLEFDYIIIGRGEKSFPELIETLMKNYDIRDLESIAYRDECNRVVVQLNGENETVLNEVPDRSFQDRYLDENLKIACISTMRGCYFNCYFCSIKANDKVAFQTKESIEQDISNIVKNSQIHALYFTNPDFLSNKKHYRIVLSILNKFKQINNFMFSTRADSVILNKDDLYDVFNAGCNSIELGIESFSDSQLKRYNKKISKSQNIESIMLLSEMKKYFNFRLVIEIIPFDPWVTIEELKDTISNLLKLPIDFLEEEPWLFVAVKLYPNTMLRQLAINDGLTLGKAGIEVPYWKFKNVDAANVYAYMIRFKKMLYKRLLILRVEIRKEIESEHYEQIMKFNLSRMLTKLSKITFNYMYDLINANNDIEIMEKIFSEVYEAITYDENKIKNIKENK